MLQEENINTHTLEKYPRKVKVVISTTTKGGILELRLKKKYKHYNFDKKVLVSYDDKTFGQQKLEIISEIFKIIKYLPDPLNEKLNNITLNSIYNDLYEVFNENDKNIDEFEPGLFVFEILKKIFNYPDYVADKLVNNRVIDKIYHLILKYFDTYELDQRTSYVLDLVQLEKKDNDDIDPVKDEFQEKIYRDVDEDEDEDYKELLVTLYSNRYYTLFRQFHTFGISWYNDPDYIIFGNLNFQYDYVNENVIKSVVSIYLGDKKIHDYDITDIRDGFSDEDLNLKIPKGTCVIEPLPISVFEDGTTEYKHNHRKKKQTFIPFIGIAKKLFDEKLK